MDTIRRQQRPLGELRLPDHVVAHPRRRVPLVLPDPGLVVVDLAFPALVAGRRA